MKEPSFCFPVRPVLFMLAPESNKLQKTPRKLFHLDTNFSKFSKKSYHSPEKIYWPVSAQCSISDVFSGYKNGTLVCNVLKREVGGIVFTN